MNPSQPIAPPSSSAQPPAMLRALRHRTYRLFFTGQLASLVGTWMQLTAQGWLVLRLTDSPTLLGAIGLASALPILLLSIPAGVLADRMPRRTLLITSNAVALMLALLLALLTLSGNVVYWQIALLAAGMGATRAFEAPARQAFTIEMVGREDLLNAIALNSIMFNAGRTLGPALAGFVIAGVGEGMAFLLNSMSFIAVLVSLLLMRLPPAVPAPATRRRDQYAAGFTYIRTEPIVRTLLLIAASVCLFAYVYIPLLPVFARDVFLTDARGLGWLGAASGAGAMLAALLLAQRSERIRRGRWLSWAAVGLVPLLLLLAVLPFFAAGMLLIALMGAASVLTMALTNTLIQTAVPDQLRARVMSVFVMLPLGVTALGGMVAGALVEWSGSVALVVMAAAILHGGVVGFCLWRTPQLQQL